MARSVRGGELAQHAVHHRDNVFAGNMFLKIKRYGKELTGNGLLVLCITNQAISRNEGA